MDALGLEVKENFILNVLTESILKPSKSEGGLLNKEQSRSSDRSIVFNFWASLKLMIACSKFLDLRRKSCRKCRSSYEKSCVKRKQFGKSRA
jgi:hypothetical protein